MLLANLSSLSNMQNFWPKFVNDPVNPFLSLQQNSKMSSLYPSLEDMQVDKIMQAQSHAAAAQAAQSSLPAYTQNPYPQLNNTSTANNSLVMYPNLGEFMGLDLSEDMIRTNMPEYLENAVQPVRLLSSCREFKLEIFWFQNCDYSTVVVCPS